MSLCSSSDVSSGMALWTWSSRTFWCHFVIHQMFPVVWCSGLDVHVHSDVTLLFIRCFQWYGALDLKFTYILIWYYPSLICCWSWPRFLVLYLLLWWSWWHPAVCAWSAVSDSDVNNSRFDSPSDVVFRWWCLQWWVWSLPILLQIRRKMTSSFRIRCHRLEWLPG